MGNKLNELQNTLCELCANTLFDKKFRIPENIKVADLLTEADRQAVYSIAVIGLKKQQKVSAEIEISLLQTVAENIAISCNHLQIAKAFYENGIKYVFIKGVASAAYYNSPDVRMMGDVDVLIEPADIQKANDLLQQLGYKTDDDIFKKRGHIAYMRQKSDVLSVCEVHFRVKGIPASLADTFNGYLSGIFDNVKEIYVAGGKCFVPSDFHHGIILLLHTATHLTSEGVGLRHLCDWAVFVNGFSNDDFIALFERPLKELGLWRFAQLLTLCCIRFLKIDNKEWAGAAEEDLLKDIICDIISGGNFGVKDDERYRQIKYISDRESRKVAEKSTFGQLLASVNAKAKAKYRFTQKCKLLLPLGWIAVVFKWLALVLTRKRKIDSIKTVSGAKHRQNIYKKFELFNYK